ncbi:prenyltransferase/squalene oxidase repeat-containing protein [Streptomyces sp. NBC_01497]|uniref:prenyltransferase/squalene oxidase repeat-containing protein n=1 Tax=Streptomyces sp. NBC_01497 TaxID=2903885 RepID=UPI002E35F377|nr:prenyltransferase/squalene oxidase repeat-containing protein [Streptomyces sp. NBC_01497]
MTTAARRVAAALAASALLCGGLALSPGAAEAATPSPHVSHTAPAAHAYKRRPADAGLYGATNPAADGVTRQSLAMLGLYAANMRPAGSAIRWLQAQQCADGSFTPYRAQAAAPCAPTAARDTTATALGMQALASVGGQGPRLVAALNWLRTQQNADGGWGSAPGAPTNASSTSLVIGTIAMMGSRPSSVRSPFTGNQGYDALVGLALPCSVSHGAGAFAAALAAPGQWPVADARSTADALLGGIGKRYVAAPVQPGPAPVCDPAGAASPEGVARNGAAYLAPLLTPAGAHLTTASGAADPSATADAVVAMCAAGYGRKATGALHWLEANTAAWAKRTGPAAYAQLIFAAHTAGVDPADFGGVDLVKKLEATGPPAAPRPVPKPTGSAAASAGAGATPGAGPTASPSPTPSEAAMNPAAVTPAADADDSPVLSGAVWWVAIALIVLIAAGVVVVNRRSAHGRPRG